MYDSESNNWVNISLDKLIEEINKDNNYITEEAFSELSAIVENNYSSLLESLQNEVETAREAEENLGKRIDVLDFVSTEKLSQELSSYASLQKLTDDYYGKTAIDELLKLKADIATTLAGYGIIDAYTKAETDQAIADKVANITGGESAAAVKMSLEAEVTRSITKDTEHDIALNLLDERLGTIEGKSWEHVIEGINEEEFSLENKILSLNEISSSKISGLENHSVITSLQDTIGQNTQSIASLSTFIEEAMTQLNSCVQKSTYDEKMKNIDADIATLKEAMSWKIL